MKKHVDEMNYDELVDEYARLLPLAKDDGDLIHLEYIGDFLRDRGQWRQEARQHMDQFREKTNKR